MTSFRWIAAILGLFGAVACSPRQEPPPPVVFSAPVDCRTVSLFDKQIEPPSSAIPAEWRVFAGHWGRGAWDGKLCHEIIVEAVYPDGTARIVDMQGYYTPWDRVPTAFRRKGVFTQDGALVVKIGRSGTLTYRYQNGVIVGVWEDATVNREVGVTLRRI